MAYAIKIKACTDVDMALGEIRKNGISATLVGGGSVCSMKQVEAACLLAKTAMKEERAISNNLGIEFLLWLANETHVQNAIEKIGAKNGKEMVLVLFDEDVNEKEAEMVAGKVGLKPIGKINKNCKEDKMIIEMMALSRIQS